MTPEELFEFEEVLSSLRMHGTDNEYVQEIDSLLTPLIESLKAAHAERDAARAEMDEFAIAIGYGERPEGQSGVHRLHGEQLAARWKQIEKECDEAREQKLVAEQRFDTMEAAYLKSWRESMEAIDARRRVERTLDTVTKQRDETEKANVELRAEIERLQGKLAEECSRCEENRNVAWAANSFVAGHDCGEEARELYERAGRAEQERDEARAEVERLRKELELEQEEVSRLRKGVNDLMALVERKAIARRVEQDEAQAEIERLKQSVANLDALYVSRTDALRESEAEVERLRAERDEARKWLEGICVEFESTIAHAEWRAAGSKGMSVPFFGDFADAARHPGMIGRMGWWVKVFRAALGEGER